MEVKRVKAKVVMLPTDEKTDILVNIYRKDKLVILNEREKEYEEYIGKVKIRGFQYQHLYFTTDEEIKEGDWYIHNQKPKGLRVQKCIGDNIPMDAKKIIATTDKSLIIGKEHDDTVPYPKMKDIYLPQPSKAFIEKYVEVGGIDEVVIDYEVWDELVRIDGTFIQWTKKIPINGIISGNKDYKPKVNKHNEIATHPIKNSWSREEVEEKMRLAYIVGQSKDKLEHYVHRENWIKDNL